MDIKSDSRPLLNTSQEEKLQIEDTQEPEWEINLHYMLLMIMFAAIGGFLFGYDTSVIAGANLYIDNDFPGVTNFQKELIVSMTTLGAGFGSLSGGSIADRFGRKPTIIIADFLFTIGCVVMAFTPSIAILIIGRFIVGLGVGVAAMVVPVYLAEISPKKYRGVIVNSNVVFIALGQFIALAVWLLLGDKWRWMLGLAAIPAILQGVGLLYLYESPRWLSKKYRYEEAKQALMLAYKAKPNELKAVFDELVAEASRVREYEEYSYFELLKQLFTDYKPWLIVGCSLQVFQQLCGINTAMYYGPEIMKTAGFGDEQNKDEALISTLPLAAMNTLGSIIALAFIDRLGRRWIMLRTLPFVGLFMTTIGVGMFLRNHADHQDKNLQLLGKWSAASGIFLYLMAFSIGMGPTPWTVNSEIYPLHLRGIGNSMSATANWISNFVVSISFLTLLKDVPFGDVFAFILIVFFSILALVFVYMKVPETKGLSLDKVLSLFVKDRDSETVKIL